MAKTCILKFLECFLKYQHVVDLKEGEPTSWLVFYIYKLIQVYSISSVSQSSLTLWDRIDCSTPGLPVHHQLPEFTQIHVHWIGDAIQPSHPLSFPSPPAFSFSQHQSFQMNQFFTSGGQRIGVSASGLELPMDIQDGFPLGWTSWISLQSNGYSGVFSNTILQKHQFFSAQLSL